MLYFFPLYMHILNFVERKCLQVYAEVLAFCFCRNWYKVLIKKLQLWLWLDWLPTKWRWRYVIIVIYITNWKKMNIIHRFPLRVLAFDFFLQFTSVWFCHTLIVLKLSLFASFFYLH